MNPQAEVIVYVYTPLPADSVPDSQRLRLAPLRDAHGAPVEFPKTPEEWTERRWVDYACHADAPWLSDRLRQRIRDFVTVLRCRFPTVQDTRSPDWAKSCAARARELALRAAPLRRALGAHGVAEPHRPARPARHEPLSVERNALHVVQISFFVDPQRRAPQTLLHDWFPLVDVAAAVASAGQAHHGHPGEHGHAARSRETAPRFTSWHPKLRALRSRAAARFARCCASSLRTCFTSMASAFRHEVRELHELAPSTPILLQDHADRVPRFWRRSAWRSGAAVASGLSFCARAQAEPFRRARLLPSNVEIFEIPELTSSFAPGDRAAARAATGAARRSRAPVGRPTSRRARIH